MVEIITSATINGRLTVFSLSTIDGQSSFGFEIATENEKATYIMSEREARRVGKMLLRAAPRWPRRIYWWLTYRIERMIERIRGE